MPDKSSLTLRVIETEQSRMSTDPIALQVQGWCRGFCEPPLPGESRKAQINRGWINAGRPAFWRFRAGFYGEGGCWSAQAVAEFQRRYQSFLERGNRKAAQAEAIEEMKRGARSVTLKEQARDEYRTLVARIEAIEAALGLRL